MKTCVTGLRTVASRAKEVVSAPFRMVSAWLLSQMSFLMMLSPTLCAKINKNLDLDTLFGNIMELIIKFATYVGVGLAAYGIFSWLNAMKEENPEGQSRAIKVIVIGGALIGFRGILQLAGIIS